MSRRRIGQALVASLHEPSPVVDASLVELLSTIDRDRLVLAAVQHGVEAWLGAAATRLPDADLAARLRLPMMRTKIAQAQARADLLLVAASLDDAAVPWITFKGPVLDQVIHATPGRRAYGDLDVLVEPATLGVALEVLEATGAVVVDRNWVKLEATRAGAVHLELVNGSVLDLHWSALESAVERSRFNIDSSGLVRRRRLVELFDRQIPTMDPVDTTAFVALHAASHGAGRLIWLKDVEQCLASLSSAWGELEQRCREWRVELAVATVLARARHVLNAAVPRSTLRALGYVPPWATFADVLDVVAPPQRSRGGRSVPAMVSAAAGHDQRESAGPLVRRTGQALRHPLHRPPPAPSRDPDDPSSPFHPLGGAEGRAAYLARVARHG